MINESNIVLNSSGYSGTPLAKKLGIKDGFIIKLMHAPDYYFQLFTDLPSNLKIVNDTKTKKNLIHYFAKDKERMKKEIIELRKEIEENGMIWVSWPKKSSKIKTEIDENIIREHALKNGLVDVKVCAVDATWSALKLVIRLKDRK